MDLSNYVPLSGFVTPAYVYIEGTDNECGYVDSQMCYIKIIPENPHDLIDGKNWWIIEPFKPEGVVINNEEDYNKYVKYLITVSSIEEDELLEWDFETHKPIKNESNIS